MKLQFIPRAEFDKVQAADLKLTDKLALLAKMNRLNALFAVKKGGSGHLGSSFSAMDVVVYLYNHYMNVRQVGIKSPDRDIYFSSKGHDAPGFYAVLHSLGIVPEEKFLKLRRLGGLDGHPDVGIPGVEANTGSLGMGISKGKGMAFAKSYKGRGGRIFVMVGDGELQEGQNFEALQSAPQQKISNVTVIMDHNKLQSDRLITRIVDLGDMQAKFSAFGWHVARCDGHDFEAMDRTFKALEKVTDKPKFLILDTIKGRGVSFMEHPRALEDNGGYYKWHAGAPADEHYLAAFNELREGVENDFRQRSLGALQLKETDAPVRGVSGVSDEVLKNVYGQALVELGRTNRDFIVLDADLSLDCGLRDFEDTFPDRFLEVGIAEQDMVSTACGIAAQGLVPVVNSFANFLCARANEQAYNTMTEYRKVVYAAHFGGLLPAGPGKSHQSVRDISLFAAFPNCAILQASGADEMRMATRYAIEESSESTLLRINVGPTPRKIAPPAGYRLTPGRGFAVTSGKKNVMFAYGPAMLHEAIGASELLQAKGKDLKIVNMPWLNRFDAEWLKQELAGCENLFVLDDHSPTGGLGDLLTAFLIRNGLATMRIEKFGVEGYPACGGPAEVLRHHRLDAESLAERVERAAK